MLKGISEAAFWEPRSNILSTVVLEGRRSKKDQPLSPPQGLKKHQTLQDTVPLDSEFGTLLKIADTLWDPHQSHRKVQKRFKKEEGKEKRPRAKANPKASNRLSYKYYNLNSLGNIGQQERDCNVN